MRTSRGCRMLAACFTVIVWLVPTQAYAAITPTTDPNALASAMLQSPGVLTGAAFEALPPDARSAASSNEAIAGFPSYGGSFGVLSTGDVAAVSAPASTA